MEAAEVVDDIASERKQMAADVHGWEIANTTEAV
jgi:hypothetical protein